MSQLHSLSAHHPSTPTVSRTSATPTANRSSPALPFTHHHHHHHQQSYSSHSPHLSAVRASNGSDTNHGNDEGQVTIDAPSSSSATAFPDVFADEVYEKRRDSLALPRLETEITVSVASSPPSSPYISPRLPPKQRQGGMSSMGDITLPPLSSAVPMRRGAVSGASSGPSLPFPPIRLPPNEEDIPSRGPSPTLGKRASFSLGHSNHVPPGPDMQLPTPALSGSAERRGGIAVGPPGHGGQSSSMHGDEYSRTGAVRMAEDGSGYYYASTGGNPNVPRSAGAPSWSAYPKPSSRHEMDEGNGSQMYNYNSASVASNMPRPGAHFVEEPYYGGAANNPHAGPPGMHASRYGQTQSSYGMPPRQMGYGLSMGPDDHLMPINGKRPRSAPRVLSSQPRIFACSQCPARFARNHDLKRHQRGHLSVRPYPCTWCGKSFSRKDALKRHVLVKGCGKDKSGGGNDSSGRRGNGSDEYSGSRSHHEEDDSHQDEDQSGEEDESQADGSQNGSFQHHSASSHGDDPHAHAPYSAGHAAYRHPSHSADAGHGTGGLYRWSKPNTMPNLAAHHTAAASMRANELTNPVSSFAGFTAGRRPSASMA